MVFGFFCAQIDPGLEHFKDEEIVLVDKTVLGGLFAFEIGETLGHQRRRHALGRHRRQTDLLELLHVQPPVPTSTTWSPLSSAGTAIARFFVTRDAGRRCADRRY